MPFGMRVRSEVSTRCAKAPKATEAAATRSDGKIKGAKGTNASVAKSAKGMVSGARAKGSTVKGAEAKGAKGKGAMGANTTATSDSA